MSALESDALAEARALQRIIDDLAKTESWSNNRFPCDYLMIDTETTGFSSAKDRVVQLGMMLVKDCEPISHFWDEPYKALTLKWPAEHFVGREGAVNVHGIGPEKSWNEGIWPGEAMEILYHVIQYAREQGMMIAGHNLYKFDIPFLQAEMARAGFTAFQFYQNEIVDTGMIVKAMQLGMLPDGDRVFEYWRRVSDMRARGIYWKLDGYCTDRFQLDEKYEIDTTSAHDAGYDCWITHCLVLELNKLLDALEEKESA